ncbi:MAG TPA: BACON domain-containing protein [Vicinamibacterales bacterium]|nr:BACON domain-containing protein [Vicinamibacterales bacterium]
MRYVTAFLIIIAASAGCARGPERSVVETPAGPSVTAARTSLLFGDIGGVSGAMDFSFPPRDETFVFGNNLNTKYQQMGRAASSFYIDLEGLIVWTQEYIRYRVNGCDHTTALQRVLTQIAGGAAGGVCGEPPSGVINFPSRADVFAAIREIDARYQQMGRGLTQLFVDLEGAAIWIQEFLRYRANACDTATSQQKVFSQIDGGPVPATCFVSCSYNISPATFSTGASAASSTFEIRPPAPPTDPRSCGWTASSDQSWLTITGDNTSGNGFTNVPFAVARNDGGDRTGRIRVRWSGGEAAITVHQAGSPFVGNLVLRDPARAGTDDVTECHLRTASVNCTLIATTNLPGNNYTYSWVVQYTYGNDKSFTANNTSSTITVTEQCGGTGSGTDGPATGFAVTVTITDDRGNSITMRRDFALRLFTCGT